MVKVTIDNGRTSDLIYFCFLCHGDSAVVVTLTRRILYKKASNIGAHVLAPDSIQCDVCGYVRYIQFELLKISLQLQVF